MEAKQINTNIFAQEFQIFLQKCSEEEKALIKSAMPLGDGPKPNIARQQLKTIKKIVQSSQKSHLKDLLSAKISKVIIPQYIFGDLQSKPFVLNIFKKIDIDHNLLISYRQRITGFQQIKRSIEVLQAMRITDDKIKQTFQPLLQNLLIDLSKILDASTLSICNNQFRTKWLDSFVQILRCVNFVLRFIGNPRFNQQPYSKTKQQIQINIQKCIDNFHVVSKQIITQLFLASVFMQPNQPVPVQDLKKVHYLHACGIINNKNTIPQFLELLMKIKDTETKTQMAPIILKAFQMHYRKDNIDNNLKNNGFDIIITLFEVGRAVYSYLQQIIDIIIVNQGAWNFQGNFTRRYCVARVALKHYSAQYILELWPNAINDCFNQSGNMTLPYVADCTEILLRKLYQECKGDYQVWIKNWIGAYKKALLANNRSLTRGVIQFINPTIIKIDPNPYLLQELLIFSGQNGNQQFQQVAFEDIKVQNIQSNIQLGVISLIKCYRQLGKIVPCTSFIVDQSIKQPKKKNVKTIVKSITYKEKYPTIPNNSFVHIDFPQKIQISQKYLLDLLLSNDYLISCKTLEFLISNRKTSTLLMPEQMDLIIQFYRGCLKTSMPEYRKNYLNQTRKMLERFRRIYEKDIISQNKKDEKNNKQTEHFEHFVKFLNDLIYLCFKNIYPDSIFEITNPSLEILQLIVSLFGQKEVEIRKGIFIKPSKFLSTHTKFFHISNFYNLVSCLQSSYESVRKLAHKLLDNFHLSAFSEQNRIEVKNLWLKSIQHTNKLAIKSYEFACRLLAYISSRVLCESKQHPEISSIIGDIPNKYKLPQLNICQFFLNVMRQRYEIFKKQFIEESKQYYSNLIHGLLTFFSYLLQSEIFIPSECQQNDYEQIQNFLTDFFTLIIQILNFAVQISSANVSTVVLDTLSHGSQTDKQLKVDCRGHFLTSKDDKQPNKNISKIGSYLDSTALMPSMQNQEQGIENTLVVSFYLLTRQAGLVFQTIGELISNKNSKNFIPKNQLITLINTYFFALINLKHMGSVDRISIGLSRMAKVIFDHEDHQLNKIPQRLLQKLVTNLSQGKFTNILRRSAGVPYAFSCLLKSQALKRKHLIDKTIHSLLDLSSESQNTMIELRIHSLNILKKLFQDSDLKQDLDIFVSEAFIKSIKGFTSQQWGVRNSALMLFSTLANRTVGIKPTYNLLQFFHKCPAMLDFIKQQLSSMKRIAMYPPLYPIVLLLSRLLPFDIKQKNRMTIKGVQSDKQVRKQQLLALLPLIQSAGDNHNFMGRVMTAKAILPFMSLTNILPHCLQLLQSFFRNIQKQQIDNNSQHYRLTQCYQLILSYHQILQNNNKNNIWSTQYSQQIKSQIQNILVTNLQNINFITKTKSLCSPTVLEILFKIYRQLLEKSIIQDKQANYSIFQKIIQTIQPLFQQIIIKQNKSNIICEDLGHSLMHTSIIQLLHLCYTNLVSHKSQEPLCKQYIRYLNHIMNQDKNKQKVDNQIRCLIIEKICGILAIQNAMNLPTLQKLRNTAFQWLTKIRLENITNDNITIHVLELLSNAEILQNKQIYKSQNHTILQYLQKLETNAENKYLKMAVFNYFQNSLKYIKVNTQQRKQIDQILGKLLYKYSSPDQLQELRETCVEYLEEIQPEIKRQFLVIYLRLLEDQQQQLRKRTSQAICHILKIPACNEDILFNKLLSMFISDIKSSENGSQFLNQFLTEILSNNSDYKIKKNNYQEQRIFSYDKPNKYRTDINTLIHILNVLSKNNNKWITPIINSAIKNTESDLKTQEITKIVKKYKQQIMQRDEYLFESIIRAMMKSLPNDHIELLKSMIQDHCIFREVFDIMSPQ